jgi:XTP/dITP diphosphohydrolase
LTGSSDAAAAFKAVLASGNSNKRAEFADFFKSKALEPFNIELVCTGRLAETKGAPPEPEETGASYEENAAIKAQAWADFFGIPAIADDSGLEARHLSWRPGIFSARAAPGTDAERTEWLLREMSGASDRRARFVACIVIAFPSSAMLNWRKGKRHVCGRRYFASEGICWGNIAHKPSGTDGFGYDPVFIPDGYENTFSELGKEMKSRISHRAKAMAGVAQIAASVIKYWSVRKQAS